MGAYHQRERPRWAESRLLPDSVHKSGLKTGSARKRQRPDVSRRTLFHGQAYRRRPSVQCMAGTVIKFIFMAATIPDYLFYCMNLLLPSSLSRKATSPFEVFQCLLSR